MAFATCKFSDLPLKSSLSLNTHHSHSLNFSIFFHLRLSSHILKPTAALKAAEPSGNSKNPDNINRRPYPWDEDADHEDNSRKPKPATKSKSPSAPWLAKWPPSAFSGDVSHSKGARKVAEANVKDPGGEVETLYFNKGKGQNAIDRIVLRLRNLGIGSDEDVEEKERSESRATEAWPLTGEEKLGDLLMREWVRPDMILAEEKSDAMILPWEREGANYREMERDRGLRKRRIMMAPSLAELTIEDEELRRLRRNGMQLRERISVPKAGLTAAVLEKIHGKWRKDELVRLKFHEVLAQDMKKAHEIVERRTGGLVTWRSGSVMVVYRGSNYAGPLPSTRPDENATVFVPDVSSSGNAEMQTDKNATEALGRTQLADRSDIRNENVTEEEAEYNALLDGLGPRFVEWWGTGVLPVDADLLPQKIPGYKTPFRLLPAGMRSRLTNNELTNLRKLAKSLPCHFALGRNRNHQGLAAAILKLWEKSIVVKIAVKQGIQNTNNKLMAEEIMSLTGGTLLLRNKYFIVIYRGKDFVPIDVAATLAQREELTKQIQDVEEEVRCLRSEANLSGKPVAIAEAGTLAAFVPIDIGATLAQSKELTKQIQDVEEMGHATIAENAQGKPIATAQAGTLAEFYEAQARWGRDISTDEREKMIEDASKAKRMKEVRRIEHKLSVAQAKKHRAEKLLSKIEAAMLPSGPDFDQETITDEERVMFRKVGLRMKPYLPLGIRGVFDGVIENMHLHWKYRELVKLITKQKTLAFVEDTARLIEYESGGVLVAIERVPKGYCLIYYRGKNYKRPISIRPRNLLTKAKALKRSVAMQRHEALSQHIAELEKTTDQLKKEMGITEDMEADESWSEDDPDQSDKNLDMTQSEDENYFLASESDDEDDEDGENGGEYADESGGWEDDYSEWESDEEPKEIRGK